MNVAELARRAGIAPSAVRWYEREGVIPPARRRPNGYRSYGDRDLARLRLVVSLRGLGVGPRDAGRLAGLCLDRAAISEELVPLVAAHRAAIALQRERLDRLEEQLADLEATIGAAGRAEPREVTMTGGPIRVLFVCTGNSARSQLGGALLGRMGGADFEVASAGTDPTGVNPYTVRVLAGLGIDWSGARSEGLERYAGERWDYVITVCDRAKQSCPVVPGEGNRLHWGLEDPAEVEGSDAERLVAFERTALELTQRLRPFIEIALRSAGRAGGSRTR